MGVTVSLGWVNDMKESPEFKWYRKQIGTLHKHFRDWIKQNVGRKESVKKEKYYVAENKKSKNKL